MINYSEEFRDALNILTNNDFHIYAHTDELYESKILDDSDFNWHEGASKVVICLDGYVLKKSYCGSCHNKCEDDEEDEDCEDDIIYDEEPFPDYARTEYLVYEAAKDYGIQHLFAKTIQVNDVVYAQERVDFTADEYENDDIDEDIFDDSYFDGEEFPPYIPGGYARLTKLCQDNKLGDFKGRVRPAALSYLLGALSPEELRSLSKFLKDYDINDIHTANIGWIDGELKIFDFCGFKSNTGKLI